MSLNDELTALEAVVNACETLLADGSISVDAHVRRCQKIKDSITDRNAQIIELEKMANEIIERQNSLALNRLRELKMQYPNDARINKLAKKAGECSLALQFSMLDASELTAPPEEKQKKRLQNQEIKEMMKQMVSFLIE